MTRLFPFRYPGENKKFKIVKISHLAWGYSELILQPKDLEPRSSKYKS